MSKTLAEQETVIRWDREQHVATCYTASPVEAARWRKRGLQVAEYGRDGWQATVPSSWVSVRKPRTTSQASRDAARARLAMARENARSREKPTVDSGSFDEKRHA